MKLFSWLLLSVMLACSNSGDRSYSGSEAVENEAAVYDNDMALKESQSVVVPQQERAQKIIKESYLRFETSDLDKTYHNIIKYTRENNGYIQSDVSGKGYQQLTRTVVVRIPSEHFQKTLDSVSKDVAYFDTKRITATDVTEEFIDIEARLKAKLALEARYTELLARANSVKDILEIEKELSKIREEIEAREGRLKYLRNQVSYSTLTIDFYKQTSETGVTVSYGKKIVNALKSGFDLLSLFFLGLLNIWPFIILILIVVFLIRKKYFKK